MWPFKNKSKPYTVKSIQEVLSEAVEGHENARAGPRGRKMCLSDKNKPILHNHRFPGNLLLYFHPNKPLLFYRRYWVGRRSIFSAIVLTKANISASSAKSCESLCPLVKIIVFSSLTPSPIGKNVYVPSVV